MKAGRGFKGDVLRARVQAASSRIAQERSREAVRLASVRLASLLRLAPGIELVPVEEDLRPLEFVSLTAKETDLLHEALDTRPEIREALAERHATEHERTGATWGPLLPDLQIDLAPGALGPVLSDLESTEDYAVTVGWRIGPGGLFDFGRQNLAEARFRQAEIQIERVRQRVIDQVRVAWAQVEAKAKMLEMARQEAADAEEALTRARLDFYTVLAEYNQAQLRLQAALGRRP